MTIYVLATSDGQITQYGTVSDEDWPAFNPPGLQRIEIGLLPTMDIKAFIDQHHVLDGHVVRRSPMPGEADKLTIKADGQDTCTISSLPIPCMVQVSGAVAFGPALVDDGTLEISCDHPGDIVVVVSAPPAYLDWTVTVHAA